VEKGGVGFFGWSAAKCSGLLAHFYYQKNCLSHDSLTSHASFGHAFRFATFLCTKKNTH